MANIIPIVYQDEDIVAVHKPAGVMVHRSAKEPELRNYLLQMVRDQIGHHLFPVHRLDRPTSGILVFALSSKMARSMARMFAGHSVEKHYLAIVRGYLAPFGQIDYPLTRDPFKSRLNQVLVSAQTRYRRLATAELPVAVGPYPTSRYSLVAIQPATGRLHQIRRHCHHLSHPVIGDTVYGDGRHNTNFRTYFDCHRLLLAAVALQFPHPRTAHPLSVIAPVANDFAHIVRRLGWEKSVPRKWIWG